MSAFVPGPLGKQPIVFFFNDCVALTAALLQSLTIKDDGNMSSRIANQAGLLQFEGTLPNTFATHAQHVGDELLRHNEFIALQSIKTQEQPD